jgi:Amt family ammonium transporter
VPGIPSPIWRSAVGLVAGALVVLTSYLFERFDFDDPGGAVAVHAVCGAWAALSIGLQTLLPDSWVVALAPSWNVVNPPEDTLAKQLLGVGVCVPWVFITSAALFWLIRRIPARADKPPVAPN